MPWRDSLLPASFRGKEFKVDVAEIQGGRRTVTHEYPLRDDPFVEDLGRRARRFTVDGYIVGPEYHTARDALAEALEKEGNGVLVHPYWGVRTVVVSAFRIRESREEGGIARFAIDFEETGPARFPDTEPAFGWEVDNQADDALDAVGDNFGGLYNVDNQPQFGLDSLVTILQDSTTWVKDALKPVVTATQDLAALNKLLDGMYLDADALIRQPLVVFSRFKTALKSVFTLPATPSLGLRALLNAYGFAGDTASETTVTRQREAANQRALYRMINQVAIIEAARASAFVTYESYEQAKIYRDEILEGLDAEAEDADTGDELFSEINQLRANVVSAVPGADNDLPHLTTYTPLISRPSLAIAYELFGNIDSEADIVARNKIRHPGFVLGGRALEILTNG